MGIARTVVLTGRAAGTESANTSHWKDSGCGGHAAPPAEADTGAARTNRDISWPLRTLGCPSKEEESTAAMGHAPQVRPSPEVPTGQAPQVNGAAPAATNAGAESEQVTPGKHLGCPPVDVRFWSGVAGVEEEGIDCELSCALYGSARINRCS